MGLISACADFQKKVVVRSTAGRTFASFGFFFFLSWAIWTVLLAFKLDSRLDFEWRGIWVPLWAVYGVFYYAIWFMLGREPQTLLVRGLAIFVNPFLLFFTISNVLFTLKWDGLYDEAWGSILAPVWVYFAAFIPVGFVLLLLMDLKYKFLSVMGFMLSAGLVLTGTAMSSMRADGNITIPWIYIMIFVWWIFDAIIFIGIVVVMISATIAAKKSTVRRPFATFLWWLLVLIAFSCYVVWKILLCLRADGWIDWPYLRVFQPIFFFNIIVLMLGVFGLISRSVLESRHISESAIAQFVTKRKQFLADLETGWTNAVNSRLKDTISLESQMEKLFHDAATMFSDVIFVVRSKPIHAHRIILRLRRGHWDIIKDLEIGKIAADFDQKTNTWTFNSRSGISAAEIENALLFLYTGSNAYLPGYRAFCQKNNLSWNDTNDQLFVEQIGSNFEEVFNDGFDEEDTFSDITLVIGGDDRRLHLHKCILAARSEFFDGMFRGGFAESRQKEIKIHEDVQFETFYAVLYTAYTDQFNVHPKDLIRYLEVCHEYQFLGIIEVCQYKLHEFVTIYNIFDMVAMAELYSLGALSVYCTYFVLIEHEYLSQLPEYHELSHDFRNKIARLRRQGAKVTLEGLANLEQAVKDVGKDDNFIN